MQAVFVEDPPLQFLVKQGTTWKFNTPYSSHMGGAWERLIVVTRRVLDSLLFEVRHGKLTHEILATFLAEASTIVNNRSIVPVTTYPPFVLTQKIGDMSESPLNLNLRDLYTSKWKVVRPLVNGFWLRWRQEYLQSIQPRTKRMNNSAILRLVMLCS